MLYFSACDVTEEEDSLSVLLARYLPDLALSMCGPLTPGETISPERFYEQQLSPG